MVVCLLDMFEALNSISNMDSSGGDHVGCHAMPTAAQQACLQLQTL